MEYPRLRDVRAGQLVAIAARGYLREVLGSEGFDRAGIDLDGSLVCTTCRNYLHPAFCARVRPEAMAYCACDEKKGGAVEWPILQAMRAFSRRIAP